jgi:hypothetical protein
LSGCYRQATGTSNGMRMKCHCTTIPSQTKRRTKEAASLSHPITTSAVSALLLLSPLMALLLL